MVLVPTPVKKTVYERIFKDGVIVVKKDSKLKEHRDFAGVSNLVVMMITKSLHSRGLLIEKFNWGYHYYFLADEGVEYLRQYLHLDESAFPETHIARTTKDTEDAAEGDKPERPARGGRWGNDRE